MRIFTLLLVSLFFLASCSSTRDAKKNSEEEMETVQLPELEITDTPQLPPYQASEERINDLLHTKLDVSFDWSKSRLISKATLDFKPYFYDTDKLEIDAKGFDVNEVSLVKDGKKTPLKYTYDNLIIDIELDKTYTKDEQYQIFIDYVAKPDELEAGGSAAITSDKGLYFINADGSDPNKPQQIWTQGETEASSCWFPTIDAPNEKTTQELSMTVQERFITLSNGTLISSTSNGDGTRTDYWKQDIAHTPYLFMMFVGEMAKVDDKDWNGKDVYYLVEQEYEPYAHQIFGNTPEMIEFYSKLLDYPYPWDKYAQVVVRDFVSGAMENTTAVIFFDALHRNERELLDETYEDIIAHELFHHWFGDIVTCESWANLPLNESFATYGEYLWEEYKYGPDAADLHIKNDLSNYLQEATFKKEPLVRYYHDHREDMFDAHSYQKGGRVMHMLRNYIGDEAYFASLSKYLKDNAFKPAEIHHLRLAAEDITGRDLNWFFNQWFLGAGHPILEINHDYNLELGKYNVTIIQKQEEDVFTLPITIDVYSENDVTHHDVVMNERTQTFSFNVTEKPVLVNVDGDKMLLCEKKVNKPNGQYIVQYKRAGKYIDRHEAIIALSKVQEEKPEYAALMKEALNDPFWAIRATTIEEIMINDNVEIANTIKRMANEDDKSDVRRAAIDKLAETEDENLVGFFEKATKDKSYMVAAGALKAVASVDSDQGLMLAKKFENEDNGGIVRTIGAIYGKHGGVEKQNFFEDRLTTASDYSRYMLSQEYGTWLTKNSDDENAYQKAVSTLKNITMNDKTWWVKINSMKALNGLKIDYNDAKETLMEDPTANATKIESYTKRIGQLSEIIDEIKANETHPRLSQFYQMQIN